MLMMLNNDIKNYLINNNSYNIISYHRQFLRRPAADSR